MSDDADWLVLIPGQLLLHRSDDPDEPFDVFADPSGHPFCVHVG